MASASDLAGAVVVVTGAASALGPAGRGPGRRRSRRSSPCDRARSAEPRPAPGRRRGPHRRPRHRRPQAAPRGRHDDRPPGPVHRSRGHRRTTARSATARWLAGCSTPPRPSARRHVVLLSSATAYGAWANNPVPLTEDAPLRPNPGVPIAYEKAELERSAAEWRDAHPSATVALLRPTVTGRPAGGNGWLARALGSLHLARRSPTTSRRRSSSTSADLARAVDLARRARLDGPRNVAPDGWISGDTVAGPRRRPAAGPAPGAPRRPPGRHAVALGPRAHPAGPAPLHRAPVGRGQRSAARRRLGADVVQRGGLRRRPPGRDRGPRSSPRRRQELALGAAGVAIVGRRRRRHRAAAPPLRRADPRR